MDIKDQVAEKLTTWNIPFSAIYTGEETKWDKQTVDAYRVTIGKFSTDYYMGLGNRKLVKGAPKSPIDKKSLDYARWEKYYLKPENPSAAAVLYCLLSDAEAADYSFADWSDNFGYNNDSIKARNTYDQCVSTGLELRKVFTRTQAEELRELLQDF